MHVADLGIVIGPYPSGPTASIIDVPGVGVGHSTVVYDEPEGRGIARTGVTVVGWVGISRFSSSSVNARRTLALR